MFFFSVGCLDWCVFDILYISTIVEFLRGQAISCSSLESRAWFIILLQCTMVIVLPTLKSLVFLKVNNKPMIFGAKMKNISLTSPCLTGFLGKVKEDMEEVEEASLSGVLCSLSFTCHVCRNSFKMKCYIRKHLQKSTWYFFVPSSRYQHFRYILQNSKSQEMTNESSIPISPKKA